MVNRKICYVIVVDVDNGNAVEKGDTVKAGSYDQSHSNSTFWYTRPTLQNLLQLLGCKVHHAFKISRRVFDTLEGENQQSAVKFKSKENLISNVAAFSSNMGQKCLEDDKTSISRPYKGKVPLTERTDASYDSYDSYKTQATATVTRKRFLDVICSSLEEYRYVGPSQRADIMLACRIRERKESIIVLLCGTSGCGKSTLSSLLASRLGITTVVSTDSIRHMMRSFADEKDNPLLWASTYHAGEFLDPSSVAKAKRKKKDRELSKSLWKVQADTEVSARMVQSIDNTVDFPLLATGNTITKYTAVDNFDKIDVPNLISEQVGSKVLAIEGYKAQSEMVIESLDRLITAWEDRKDSVVVEGVHLSLNFVMGLMKKHPSIIPFLIYIGDEEKHMERFAIRAKYMTTDPSKNKYVKYIKNIRTIQDYLCKRADKHLVPKVNNTNVDRSVASIHSTIFSCLRRRQTGVPLYDVSSNTVKVINDEYRKHCDANSVSSKGMFRMIQRQGSLRRYVAIVNSDGSVAKAWPFLCTDKIREHSSSSADKDAIGNPIYGVVQVHEAKPAYVQFGNFGLGSWPNDTEGTSTRSINGSRGDGDGDTTQVSSSSSLASHQEGHAKELIEEVAASETDEETLQDDEDEEDSGNSADDLVDDELGGSVAESSTRSDEVYEIEEMVELLEDDSINMEAFGDTTTPFEGTHRRHKHSKSSSFASLRRRPIRESMSQSSGPLQRHLSLKLKSVDTL